MRILKYFWNFFFVYLPAGMGWCPAHRLNKRFDVKWKD